MSNLALNQDAAKLTPSAIIELYVLDATAIGGAFLRFIAGTGANNLPVSWQGNEYTPLPVEVKGFEFTSSGAPPRPSVSFGNIGGQFSALCINYDDLIGAKFIRKRTSAVYLDGQPGADPTKYLPDDIFFIEQKTNENKFAVSFSLGTSLDLDDGSLPKRKIIANLCQVRYRGGECGYSGDVKGDVNDSPPGVTILPRGEWDSLTNYSVGDQAFIDSDIPAFYWCYNVDPYAFVSGPEAGPPNPSFWKRDECSRRVSGCALRFAGNPFGFPFAGFPSASRQS